MRGENVRNLKKNGRLVFLDRSLENLISTNDRPLSKSPADVKRLYEKRYKIYKAAADFIIPADSSPEQNADTVMKEFFYEC
ncbi:MAG: hypothetical protein IJL87_02025 [Clostridia bacterium]|nr:hypothetical protein [Clostridia bacterium]